MSQFANCVRFLVKEGKNQALVEHHNEYNFTADGLERQYLIQTAEHEYVGVGIWDSKEALVASRPELIAFLDTIRHLLEEITPELGVTDPRSGFVVWNNIP